MQLVILAFSLSKVILRLIDCLKFIGQYAQDEDTPNVRVDAPRATPEDFWQHFSQWTNGKVLLGTAWSWFALDIAFYGLGLNSSMFIEHIAGRTPSKPDQIGLAAYQSLLDISVGNIIIACAGLLPGFVAAFFLIDRVRDILLCFVDMGDSIGLFVTRYIVGPKTTPVYRFHRPYHYIRLYGVRF